MVRLVPQKGARETREHTVLKFETDVLTTMRVKRNREFKYDCGVRCVSLEYEAGTSPRPMFQLACVQSRVATTLKTQCV